MELRYKPPRIRFLELSSAKLRLIWRGWYHADLDRNLIESELSARLNRRIRIRVQEGALMLESSELIPPLNSILEYLLDKELNCSFTRRRNIYIDSSSGIPLIGHIAFGLIDRGTNLIQVRSVCGCNLSCIFCSTDEGPISSTRWNDFLVETEYLLKEFNKLAEFKGGGLEAHLDSQGEPCLDPCLVDLVAGLRSNPKVEVISIQTNGCLLTSAKIQELEEAGLSRINLSLHTLDPQLAKMLMGPRYSLKHVLNICQEIAGSKIELLLAPVLIPGLNQDQLPELIEYAKQLRIGRRWPALGIQLYLPHKFGRNPLKRTWKFGKFYSWLRELERKHGLNPLVLNPRHFGIQKRPSIPKPLRRGEVVNAKLICEGRLKGEFIAAARDRAIQVIGLDSARFHPGARLKLRILSDSHNIYLGCPA